MRRTASWIAALLFLARQASAGDPSAPEPEAQALEAPPSAVDGPLDVGLTFGATLGGRYAAGTGPVDAMLARAGQPALAPWLGVAGVHFGFEVRRFSLALDAAVLGVPGESPGAYLSAVDLSATLGVALLDASGFRLGPTLTMGADKSTICVRGPARAGGADPADEPFVQIAAYPGRESCMRADAAFTLGLGFSLDYRLLGEEDGMAGGIYAGLRPRYTVALGPSNVWMLDDGAAVPSFRGPDAPGGGFYLGVELGWVLGVRDF